MKIPRDLSGRELVKRLCRDCDYRQIHQEGSHIILVTDTPSAQRIAILRIGTLSSILRAVSQHKSVPRDWILSKP